MRRDDTYWQSRAKELIQSAYDAIELERMVEGVSLKELSARCGYAGRDFLVLKWWRGDDFRLGTLARIMHKLNKRIRLVIEDDV